MWFGTSNGLCRYDGNSYKNFTKQNFGLLENQVTTLSIDENNHLLIEFSNVYANMMKLGEVQVLDINNYTLKTIESTYPKMPFKKKDIVWITNDENKKLIFVTASPYKVWE